MEERIKNERKEDNLLIQIRNRMYVVAGGMFLTQLFTMYTSTVVQGQQIDSINKNMARLENIVTRNTDDIREMEKHLPAIRGKLNSIHLTVLDLQKDTKSLEKNQNQIMPVVQKAHTYIMNHWKEGN